MWGLVLLLSMCQGLANGDRGNGRKGGKVIVIVMMILSAFIITQNWWLSLVCPFPQLLFWWQKGGTGAVHAPILKRMQWIPLTDPQRWRLFEIASVFTYSLLCGSIYLSTTN